MPRSSVRSIRSTKTEQREISIEVRPPGVGLPKSFSHFHSTGFIAVWAAKLVFEKNGHRNPQPMTSQECPGTPMFHALFGRKHGSCAERATRACCRQPLCHH